MIYCLPIKYHVHIWQVSTQHSRGDTCQISTLYKNPIWNYITDINSRIIAVSANVFCWLYPTINKVYLILTEISAEWPPPPTWRHGCCMTWVDHKLYQTSFFSLTASRTYTFILFSIGVTSIFNFQSTIWLQMDMESDLSSPFGHVSMCKWKYDELFCTWHSQHFNHFYPQHPPYMHVELSNIFGDFCNISIYVSIKNLHNNSIYTLEI